MSIEHRRPEKRGPFPELDAAAAILTRLSGSDLLTEIEKAQVPEVAAFLLEVSTRAREFEILNNVKLAQNSQSEQRESILSRILRRGQSETPKALEDLYKGIKIQELFEGRSIPSGTGWTIERTQYESDDIEYKTTNSYFVPYDQDMRTDLGLDLSSPSYIIFNVGEAARNPVNTGIYVRPYSSLSNNVVPLFVVTSHTEGSINTINTRIAGAYRSNLNNIITFQNEPRGLIKYLQIMHTGRTDTLAVSELERFRK